MNHADHLYLLRNGVPARGGRWGDLGAGRGAFTLALAELLGPTGEIYAVDRDPRALRQLASTMQKAAPDSTLHCLEGDFQQQLALPHLDGSNRDGPNLDGIVMANSLHFVEHKVRVITHVRSYLRPEGRLILVEYNTDRGNHWVPFPLTFASWRNVARESGFAHTELLATRPSSFLGEFYAAVSW